MRQRASEPLVIAQRYRVLRPLGRGGLASALLVRDEALGVERCLKLVEDAGADPARRLALKSEFQLLAGLDHPSLAAVHDFGLARLPGGDAFYFTADFVRGLPLDRFAAGASFEEVRVALLGPLAALAPGPAPFEVRVQRAALAIAKGQPPAARRWAGGDDPDVREALADGWPRARAAIAARILREHAAEVTFNPCPRCAHRRRSPQARLCLACGHDERT